ncbi:solute carrier family 49 member 4 homolog isoform X1 [Corticium candelabrum]|uniref:solute carrier family 49 member 4 homolog isoform X1 n=2 Tax=Corticium candelabrum TaxID=121492 RepID=UPI002E255AD6|nr:solute carrier family 49 member 4 homolog isoform X1 [Corticium candelabrum]
MAGRFYVLSVFCCFAFCQTAVWMTFSSVPKFTESVYNVGKGEVDLLLNWGSIMFVPSVVISSWILTTRNGLKRTAILGFLLTFLGSLVRLVPTFIPGTFRKSAYGHACLHVGQIFNAIAGAASMGAASRLSADWFPESQRTRVTASVYAASNLAVTVTAVIGPAIVTSDDKLPTLLYCLAGVSFVPFVSSFIHFPSSAVKISPATAITNAKAPTDDSLPLITNDTRKKLQKVSFIKGVMKVSRSYSAMALFFASGIMGGMTNIYMSVLPTGMNAEGQDETKGDLLNSMGTLASILGGILIGYIADRFFQRHLKDVLVTIIFTSFVFFFGLVYTIYLRPELFWFQVVCSLVSGFAQGGRDALTAELGAELTYPADEGTSAGIYTLIYSVAALLLIVAAPLLSTIWLGVALLAGLLLTLGLVVTIKEQYCRRSATDNETIN